APRQDVRTPVARPVRLLEGRAAAARRTPDINPIEVRGELVCRRVAAVGVVRHGLEDDRLVLLGESGPDGAGPPGPGPGEERGQGRRTDIPGDLERPAERQP